MITIIKRRKVFGVVIGIYNPDNQELMTNGNAKQGIVVVLF